MNLSSLVILLLIGLTTFQFWRLRGIGEFSIRFANQYCEKHGLQFLSLARRSTRLSTHKGKIDWKIVYQLEFSSNGEDAYIGTMTCFGNNVIEMNLPAHKIN